MGAQGKRYENIVIPVKKNRCDWCFGYGVVFKSVRRLDGGFDVVRAPCAVCKGSGEER